MAGISLQTIGSLTYPSIAGQRRAGKRRALVAALNWIIADALRLKEIQDREGHPAVCPASMSICGHALLRSHQGTAVENSLALVPHLRDVCRDIRCQCTSLKLPFRAQFGSIFTLRNSLW